LHNRQINDEKTQWTQPELKLVKFHNKKMTKYLMLLLFFLSLKFLKCVF